MKSLLALASLSALMIGCGKPEHGMHYTILLDHSLNTQQMEESMQVAHTWELAIPGLSFDYQSTSCVGFGDAKHTICLRMDSGMPPNDAVYHVAPNATTDWPGQGFLAPEDSAPADSATIRMWSTVMAQKHGDYTFSNSLRHELGHAMTHTGSHLPNEDALMFGAIGGRTEKPITQNDVDYFWQAR